MLGRRSESESRETSRRSVLFVLDPHRTPVLPGGLSSLKSGSDLVGCRLLRFSTEGVVSDNTNATRWEESSVLAYAPPSQVAKDSSYDRQESEGGKFMLGDLKEFYKLRMHRSRNVQLYLFDSRRRYSYDLWSGKFKARVVRAGHAIHTSILCGTCVSRETKVASNCGRQRDLANHIR